MQRDIDKMWAIETSLLSQLLSNLPTTGSHLFFLPEPLGICQDSYDAKAPIAYRMDEKLQA
jgi:hypothetical protein